MLINETVSECVFPSEFPMSVSLDFETSVMIRQTSYFMLGKHVYRNVISSHAKYHTAHHPKPKNEV